MIRVLLPYHLQRLAETGQQVLLELNGPVTQRAILDALEQRYPVLRGTLRFQDTLERRPYIRFFACGEDVSHQSMDAPLPEPVAKGEEVFRIVGAMAGG